MTAFWGIGPCGLVKQTDVSEVCTVFIIRRIEIIALMMNAVSTSEKSLYFNETTR
jgi:hypothetical protein